MRVIKKLEKKLLEFSDYKVSKRSLIRSRDIANDCNLKLSEIAISINGDFCGVDKIIKGVSTDTRTIKKDQLFIGLRGPNLMEMNLLMLQKKMGPLRVLLIQILLMIFKLFMCKSDTKLL